MDIYNLFLKKYLNLLFNFFHNEFSVITKIVSDILILCKRHWNELIDIVVLHLQSNAQYPRIFMHFSLPL